jgi:hypothetical protein
LSTPIFHLLVWVLSRKPLPNQSPIYLPIIYSISCITYLLPIYLYIGIRKGHIYVPLVNHFLHNLMKEFFHFSFILGMNFTCQFSTHTHTSFYFTGLFICSCSIMMEAFL